MQEWIVPALAGLLALVALGLAVALTRSRARTERALARASAETAALREQLTALEQRLARPAPTREAEASFVITDLGQQREPEPPPAPAVSGTLFADLVLRETVVKAAGLAHGVRRALDPEVRHRVRYEMRREIKRSRKQRKADTREARRAWAARQRASLDEEGSAA